MSWEGEPAFRWVKMYKGERFRVGCHELPIGPDQWSKEASGGAANEWWAKTLTALQARSAEAHPYSTVIDQVTTRLDYCISHGRAEDAELLKEELQRLTTNENPEFDDETLVETESQEELRKRKADLVFGQHEVWEDRLERTHRPPHEATVGGHVERYVKERQAEAVQGVRSHENADSIKRSLRHFTEFVGTRTPVDGITYDLWKRWFVHCQAMIVKHDTGKQDGWGVATAQKYFITVRAFVKELSERDILLTPPKNLTSKAHTFERPERVIPTFTGDEVRQLVGNAQGVHRLILLLMLNTGATQKDVADLRRDQVDLDAGRITRRRSKTRKKRYSRLVSYALWPETAALLREHMRPDGDRALVTKSGKPWVWTETVETTTGMRLRKSDNVATIFNNIKRRIGWKAAAKSVKVFRKTSATLIKRNPTYKDLRFWFLGHSERTVADIHYGDNSQAELDAAVGWLRTEYGL